MEKALLRVDEAAAALNVSRWTIYRWVNEGRLRATRIGRGSLRVLRHSVAELIVRNMTEGANPPGGAAPETVPGRATPWCEIL
jgi:excisionase family DNA binding protein